MAKTKNTAEPMEETPEVLEEITMDVREEIPSDPELVERPEITEDPDGPRTLDDEPEQLRTADDSDVSPLADIDPATRIEFFLDEIATGLAELVPATRIEEFLHRIAVRLNTIYIYVPVIPDAEGEDIGKVMAVVEGAASGDPNRWAAVTPIFSKGSGDDSVVQNGTNIDANLSTAKMAIALGITNEANGMASIAGGQKVAQGKNIANGNASIAYGKGCVTNSDTSIAFGQLANTGSGSVGAAAFGSMVTSNSRVQFVVGQSNIIDENAVDSTHGNGARKYLFIIGNGSANGQTRSNALTVDWSGNLSAAGIVTAANIPAAPAAVGIYKLTCSVNAQGVASYDWISDPV